MEDWPEERVKERSRTYPVLFHNPLRSVPQDPSAHLGEGLLPRVSTKGQSGAILLKATVSLTFQSSLGASH